MRILNDYVRKTESKVLIHEIVEAEILGHLKDEISKDFEQIEDAFRKTKKYSIENLPTLDFAKVKNKNIKQKKKDFLGNLYNENTLRVKIDGRKLREVIRRSVERKAPCSKNGEELRDAIIWLNLLKYCTKQNRDFTFISNNIKDFADDDKKSLHRDLVDDVKRCKIRVQYFTKLEDFLREHAEPIDHITSEWINGRIEMISVENFIKDFLLFNEVAHYFTPCDDFERNYLVPKGKPEFPSWAIPRIELEDFFVWRFDDQHVELSLIFYVYIEAEFNCEQKYLTLSPSYCDSYSSNYATSYASNSWLYSSGDISSDLSTYCVNPYYGATYGRICFSDLIFRISAKIEGDKILMEDVEDLYKA